MYKYSIRTHTHNNNKQAYKAHDAQIAISLLSILWQFERRALFRCCRRYASARINPRYTHTLLRDAQRAILFP